MSHLCRQVVLQERNGNLHIFVNSVDFISKVIKKAELTPQQVRVVCSSSGESAIKNQKKLGADYPIQSPSDPLKKVNFYTSTAFEGCDIYDEVGRTYIVSDSNKSQTMVDISTLFVQICGRLRNSIYNTEITHIFSTTRYSEDLTLVEFKESTEKTLTEAQKFSNDINAVPQDSREKILSKIPYLNEKYVRIEDNRLIVDKNFANIDIVNFKITKQIYRTAITLSEELQKHGFGVSVKTVRFETPSEQLDMNPKAKVSFRELFDEYAQLREQSAFADTIHFNFRAGIIETANPLVKESYDKLGRSEVERLNYNQTNIKRELLKRLDIDTEVKIVKCINESLPHQHGIPNVRIKQTIQEIYDSLGLEKKAKATDLNK